MAWDKQELLQLIAEYANMPGGLLPALHALHDAWGHIPEGCEADIAGAFNLTRAEVHGVISFYHDFRRTKPGYHTLKVCGAEACQAQAGRDLLAHITKKLDTAPGTTSASGFNLDVVYCLGNCAAGPAVMLDGQTYGRVSPQRIDQLIAIAKKRRLDQAGGEKSGGADG